MDHLDNKFSLNCSFWKGVFFKKLFAMLNKIDISQHSRNQLIKQKVF